MTSTRKALTPAQDRDLRQIGEGLSRGESYAACEALRRRGLVTGDWITGYYVVRPLCPVCGDGVAPDGSNTGPGARWEVCDDCRAEGYTGADGDDVRRAVGASPAAHPEDIG